MTRDPRRDTPPPTPEALAKREETESELREARMCKWLDAFAATANKREASAIAGVHYRRATDWEKRSKAEPQKFLVRWPADDPEMEPIPFHEAVEIAKGLARDMVVAEIRRRAVEGVDRPLVFQGGKTGETITEKSDLLLMFYAKQLDPSFRENYQPVDVKVSGRIDINDSARERLAERLMAAIEHP
jgi:hypothetical protein